MTLISLEAVLQVFAISTRLAILSALLETADFYFKSYAGLVMPKLLNRTPHPKDEEPANPGIIVITGEWTLFALSSIASPGFPTH